MKAKKTLLKVLPLVGCLALGLAIHSCEGDEPAGEKNPNVAVTGNTTEIGSDYAVISGEVNVKEISENYASMEVGVEYSQYDDFSPKKRVTATNLSGRDFSVEIFPLDSSTKYYYRTYVTVTNQSYAKTDYYGKTRNFTTQSKPDTPTGRYVDLGLTSGTLWATMNVGAKKPEQYGNYYAWGETNTKDYYALSSYKWYDTTSQEYKKYVYSYVTQTIDRVNLDPEDDAAYVHPEWGKEWRMPTQTQLDELIRECDWEWKALNGVNGYIVSSKKSGNDNRIFLPAAGYWEGSGVNGTTTGCYFWTRTVCSYNTTRAYCYWHYHNVGDQQRYYGLPVRAVYVGK